MIDFSQAKNKIERKSKEWFNIFFRKKKFKQLHPTVSIKKSSSILNPEKVSLAKNVKLNYGVVLQPGYWEIAIGENSLINHYVCIYGHVIIGDNVMVGPHVMFAGGYHNSGKTDIPMLYQGDGSKGPIIIGNDVWIGANAIINDGICIGEGCIIGAGAVVTKDIPPYSIAYGNPAKVHKNRKEDSYVK